jgi:hypothetical protein
VKSFVVLFITSKNIRWGLFLEKAVIDGTLVEFPPAFEITVPVNLDHLVSEFLAEKFFLKPKDYTSRPMSGTKELWIDNPRTGKTEPCEPYRYSITTIEEAKPNLQWKDTDSFLHEYVWCNGVYY